MKTSDYSCLLEKLLLLRGIARGSARRRGNTRASSCSPDKSHIRLGGRLSPPDDAGRDPLAKELVAATPTSVVPKRRRSLVLPIVLGIGFGVGAVGLAGFLVTLTSRPAPAPQLATAALPALEFCSPIDGGRFESPEQAIGPEERLSRLEPPPIQIGLSPQDNVETASPQDSSPLVELQPSSLEGSPPVGLAPLPPSRPLELAPPFNPPTSYDQSTAVYDISAHTVYLPDGMRLEAHSGLGDRIDDPRFVDERDHGATPPGVYQLTLRESLFHGVQALRLNPIGGGFTFNRVGLLAHPYMLGPNGDSNGCVSFKTYDVFLRAFQSGGSSASRSSRAGLEGLARSGLSQA